MTRSKVRKFIKIRWDLSWRKSFTKYPEHKKLDELMVATKHLSEVSFQYREFLDLMEINSISLTTST